MANRGAPHVLLGHPLALGLWGRLRVSRRGRHGVTEAKPEQGPEEPSLTLIAGEPLVKCLNRWDQRSIVHSLVSRGDQPRPQKSYV